MLPRPGPRAPLEPGSVVAECLRFSLQSKDAELGLPGVPARSMPALKPDRPGDLCNVFPPQALSSGGWSFGSSHKIGFPGPGDGEP